MDLSKIAPPRTVTVNLRGESVSVRALTVAEREGLWKALAAGSGNRQVLPPRWRAALAGLSLDVEVGGLKWGAATTPQDRARWAAGAADEVLSALSPAELAAVLRAIDDPAEPADRRKRPEWPLGAGGSWGW